MSLAWVTWFGEQLGVTLVPKTPEIQLFLGWNEIVWPTSPVGKKASDVPNVCPLAVAKENFWLKPYVRNYGGEDFGFEQEKTYYLKCSEEAVWNL